MGMAYLLMLIVYIGLSVGIYKFAMKFTDKKWIKGSLVAFFILLPTYDIIIGNALKFYYCKFTELEKINRMIERPDGVLLRDEQDSYDKKYALNDPDRYLRFRKLKFVQIKMKNDHIRTYVATGKYIDHNGEHRLKIEEINNSLKKARYSIIKDESIAFPYFVDHFLRGFETKVIDTQTGEIVAWTKTFNHKKYNFITIDTGYLLRGKWCGSSDDGSLLEKVIKEREYNAK